MLHICRRGYPRLYFIDFTSAPGQKEWKVFPILPSFYAQWRTRAGVVPLLKDDDDSPPESLLQTIWQHQRLLRDQLRTGEGQPVRVLHPGFRNVEGGPDFRGAVVQFGDDPPCSGDVEIDLKSSGWHSHAHDRNPAFGNVILHVIWDGDRSPTGQIPTLPLRQALDSSLGELNLWLGSEVTDDLPECLRGKCSAPLRNLPQEQVEALLQQAAQVRLQSKASQFQARARQAGWEQSLWEGLFRALGYKHNVWPMQRLAELRPRWSQSCPETLTLQARLYGIGGLLPTDLSRTRAADHYVRRVWDSWWREQDAFSDCILPRSLWRLHGSRPANHPQRRIALASAWSQPSGLSAKIEKWCAATIPDKALPRTLLEALQVEPDDFWSWHCTFRSVRLARAQPLLGPGRVTDLAVNVILPWLWSRTEEGRNEPLRQSIENRYYVWPAAEDNSMLRLGRRRLLGPSALGWMRKASLQQGLIQIIRDFCDRSNAVCEQCHFPELVKDLCGSESSRQNRISSSNDGQVIREQEGKS